MVVPAKFASVRAAVTYTALKRRLYSSVEWRGARLYRLKILIRNAVKYAHRLRYATTPTDRICSQRPFHSWQYKYSGTSLIRTPMAGGKCSY